MQLAPPYEPRADDPYWKRWIAKHGTSTWENLSRLPTTSPAQALEVLQGFVVLACAQNSASINLGRWGLLAMPRPWVVEQLPAAIDAVLGDGEEWEYRRTLELASLIDDDVLQYVIDRAAAHRDRDVRAAADEWR